MKAIENLRRIVITSISGSLLFSSTFVATSAHYGPADIPVASGKSIPSYEQLAKNERHFPLAQTCGGENYIPAAQETIQNNFDSKCLSKANTKLVYSVLHTDSGIPVFKIISAENATEADKFYCEQAIWEFIMRPACRGGKLTCEFSGSGQSGKHPVRNNEIRPGLNKKFWPVAAAPAREISG
jgi:hypothetical protein